MTLKDCNSGKKYLYCNILPYVLQSAGKDFGIKTYCEVATPGLRPGVQLGSLSALLELLGVFTFTFGLSSLGFAFKDNLHCFLRDIDYTEDFFKRPLEERHGGSIRTGLICKPEPVLFVLHLLIKTGLV